jgi:hypothetical protein
MLKTAQPILKPPAQHSPPQDYPFHATTVEQRDIATKLLGELPDTDEGWLDEACVLRYLRATRWNAHQASTRN